MKECIYRIPVEGGSKNVDQAFNKAVTSSIPDIIQVASIGLKQEFNNGLCQLLTANDFGPVQCNQPNHSETTCPDITSYRK